MGAIFNTASRSIPEPALSMSTLCTQTLNSCPVFTENILNPFLMCKAPPGLSLPTFSPYFPLLPLLLTPTFTNNFSPNSVQLCPYTCDIIPCHGSICLTPSQHIHFMHSLLYATPWMEPGDTVVNETCRAPGSLRAPTLELREGQQRKINVQLQIVANSMKGEFMV